ncbi:hypothetical protein M514_08975 [Trichuris suis]|uniref:Uncharacterized protein n=1 Tax=Trichuris suis TaxID=68888 RepID=A0A085NKM2_9BILA|nr:hypothetical protein M513_08975 [Trichuris suis]KFD70018.1 hypothetical protein M514_08975 [Trichuris suis]KHJ42081.1 type I phosphodiesterase / nucleotide pyrophosphatase [Trichuris suis]
MQHLFHNSFIGRMQAVIVQLVLLAVPLTGNSQLCQPRKTILVSLDGFWYGYVDKLKTLLGRQSNIIKLMENSAYAPDGIKSNYPTVTFPNHITMITGKYVEDHGIVAKQFYDPSTDKHISFGKLGKEMWKYVNGEPIWATYAKKCGQTKVACISWLGCDAPYKGIQLTNVLSYSVAATWIFKVNKIINWLTNGVNLALFYYHEPDSTGHFYGPHSTQMDEMLKELDRKVGYLVTSLKNAGLYDHVNLIITSDHGMAKVNAIRNIPIRSDLFDRWATHDAYWLVHPKPGKKQATIDYLKTFTYNGKVNVYEKHEIPAYWHFRLNERIPEILVTAEPGYVLNVNSSGSMAGQHGYGNGSRRMRALFIAHGPTFNRHANVTKTFATSDVNLVVRRSLCLPLPPFANGTYMVTVLSFLH